MTFPNLRAHHPQARAVLEFWLQDAMDHGWPSQDLGKLWFGGGAALDRDIENRFGDLVRDALAGGLVPWEAWPLDRLALVVLLDQFTRNVFRSQSQAFAGDPRAQRLSQEAIRQQWDAELPLAGRVFLTMPLMHAENLAMQDACVKRFRELLADAKATHSHALGKNLESALQHRNIIAEFGRFPHRNTTLARSSTALEQEFLRDGPRFGQ